MQSSWFDPAHAAALARCPRCDAPPQAPCVAMIGFIGTGVTGTPIRGLHAERIDLARADAKPELAA